MTRVGRLDHVLDGLRAAKAAGFTGTKLNVVLLKGFNEDEIPDFVDLACRYPLEVRFIELMPIGEGAQVEFLTIPGCISHTYRFSFPMDKRMGMSSSRTTWPLPVSAGSTVH